MKKLIVFDLDGTLAESKSSLDPEMSGLLHDLLAIVKVAVISGGGWPQFEKQLLSNLSHDERLTNLSLLPTCGTKFYRYDSADWKEIYSEDFTTEEREKILSSLKKAIEVADFKIEKLWGDQVEDRGSQITFSALGQQAPLEEKLKWDPDLTKRKKIKAILDNLFPSFLSEPGAPVLGRTVKRIQRGWIYSSAVLPRKLGAATCSSFLVQFIDFLDQDIDLFRG